MNHRDFVTMMVIAVATATTLASCGGSSTDKAGWYLEVQDCAWHQGRNPRELKRWMVDMNAVKAEAQRQGWAPPMCLDVRPSATLDWIAYCDMHDLFAACGLDQVKNTPGR